MTKIEFPEDFINDAAHQGFDVVRLGEFALRRMDCIGSDENLPSSLGMKIKNTSVSADRCVFEISRITETP